MSEKLFFIRSHKHDQNNPKGNELALWWGPDSKGYTSDLAKAGKYTEAQALAICGPFGVEIEHKKRGKFTNDTPAEIAYPVEMVSQLAQLTVNKFDVENARLRAIEREKELA